MCHLRQLLIENPVRVENERIVRGRLMFRTLALLVRTEPAERLELFLDESRDHEFRPWHPVSLFVTIGGATHHEFAIQDDANVAEFHYILHHYEGIWHPFDA